jgi:hypothetical protein
MLNDAEEKNVKTKSRSARLSTMEQRERWFCFAFFEKWSGFVNRRSWVQLSPSAQKTILLLCFPRLQRKAIKPRTFLYPDFVGKSILFAGSSNDIATLIVHSVLALFLLLCVRFLS